MRASARSAAAPRLPLLLCALLCCGGAAARVIELRDDNFDQLTRSGVWLVDIYAPWCSHCQKLEPVWRELAETLKPHGINVAKVDGTRNRVLLMRFGVEAYPSIFLLKEGRTWQYDEGRGAAQLREFALEGYRTATAMPFHKSPVSAFGRVMGALHSLPGLARSAYTHLKEEKGFADITIIGGALAIPLMIGGMAICMLDAFYTRRPDLMHHHAE